MARWPTLSLEERDRLRAEALGRVLQVNGTLLPEEKAVVGLFEIAALVDGYHAAHCMIACSWMLRIEGHPATLVSSGENWNAALRPQEARARRQSKDWAAYGRLRGRPPKAR